jgi:hypothetical protein
VVVRRRLTREAIQYPAVVGTTRIDRTFSASSLTTANQQRQAKPRVDGRVALPQSSRPASRSIRQFIIRNVRTRQPQWSRDDSTRRRVNDRPEDRRRRPARSLGAQLRQPPQWTAGADRPKARVLLSAGGQALHGVKSQVEPHDDDMCPPRRSLLRTKEGAYFVPADLLRTS